ncbi:MAG: beta-1,6-galactofuranosyltransferase, partial [Streptococcus salivarius]
TEEQYAQMVANARHTAYLISNGYFTKKLFIDAIMALS